MAYRDLDRPPLDGTALRSALAGAGRFWTDVVVTPETGSTNADVADAARAGAAEGLVHTTDVQTAGRGRLDRSWTSPAGSGVIVSALLRPDSVPAARWVWLPLLVGLAVDATVHECGVDSGLKWPNDVQVDGDKVCGLLAELRPHASAVVVGAGVNLTVPADDLPTPTSTSLGLHGARGTALELADAVTSSWVSGLARLVGDLTAARGDAVASGALALVRADCATLGRSVRVELPGGAALVGEAVDVDESGRLVVRSASTGELTAVASGDVTHLRYE